MQIAGRPLKDVIWPIIDGLLLLVCLILLVLLYSGGDKLATKAYDEGRQMAISLKTGEIDGLPLMTPHAHKEPEKPKAEETPKELPPVAQPSIESGMPGNFSAEGQEKPLPVPKKDIEAVAAEPSKKALEEKPTSYPEAVQQEPETKITATAAPVDGVFSSDLDEEGKKIETPIYEPGRPLEIAPNEKFIEKTEIGDLPKIADDGTRPSSFYAKPYDLPITDKATKQPIIAIVMTGLGLGRYTMEEAMKLPPEITFSFSPYSRDGQLFIKHARDHGHETMMDLPIHPQDYPATDPGPYALLNTLKPEENLTRLQTALSRFSGYTGVVLPAKAAAPDAVILQAMLDIPRRGLLLVDQPGPAASLLDTKKAELGLVDLTTEKPLDDRLTPKGINEALSELATTARTRGYAIGVARPYPLTIKKLRQWAPTLKQQGILLVPVSTVAQRLK